jgi:hypothetical protein
MEVPEVNHNDTSLARQLYNRKQGFSTNNDTTADGGKAGATRICFCAA